MRKLFFVVALGAAGLVSAKENPVKTDKPAEKAETVTKQDSEEVKAEARQLFRYYNWVTVTTWCGKVFYLDYNMYDSYEGYAEDAAQFSIAQCGGTSGNNDIPLYEGGF